MIGYGPVMTHKAQKCLEGIAPEKMYCREAATKLSLSAPDGNFSFILPFYAVPSGSHYHPLPISLVELARESNCLEIHDNPTWISYSIVFRALSLVELWLEHRRRCSASASPAPVAHRHLDVEAVQIRAFSGKLANFPLLKGSAVAGTPDKNKWFWRLLAFVLRCICPNAGE